MKFKYEGKEIEIILDENHPRLIKWASEHRTFKEEPMLRYLKDNEIITPLSVVMDVGSYIGNHVIYYSKIIGVQRILSFEPTLRSFNILLQNLAVNNISNVDAYNAAISKKTGFAECNIRTEDNPAKNQWFETSGAGLTSVTTFRISDFDFDTIDFIKIDVEGMELLALEGGIDLIEKQGPTIMIETFKSNLPQIESIMRNLHYTRIGDEVFTLHRHKKANTLLFKRI